MLGSPITHVADSQLPEHAQLVLLMFQEWEQRTAHAERSHVFCHIHDGKCSQGVIQGGPDLPGSPLCPPQHTAAAAHSASPPAASA